jgi:hypothetical protein
VNCAECGLAGERKDFFEVGDKAFCRDCFAELGQRMLSRSQAVATGQMKETLKKKIKEELAGIIPRDLLRQLFETGLRKILLGKEDPEDVYGWMVNQTEALCGPPLQRYRLKMLQTFRQAMEEALDREEEDARDALRKYIEFGAKDAGEG